MSLDELRDELTRKLPSGLTAVADYGFCKHVRSVPRLAGYRSSMGTWWWRCMLEPDPKTRGRFVAGTGPREAPCPAYYVGSSLEPDWTSMWNQRLLMSMPGRIGELARAYYLEKQDSA